MWRRVRHAPPPWWPDGEPWPPAGRWGQGPPVFMRRFGCLLFVFFGFAFLSMMAAGWLHFTGGGWWGRPDGGRIGPGPVWFIAFLLLLFFVAAAASARSFRRFAAPLGDIIQAAQRVEAGDYAVRVPEPRRAPRELQALARAMNTMTARLEDDEQRRRALLADVSHELRTPLAVIQGEVEAMLDGVHQPDAARLTTLLDEVQVLSRLVDDLRTLVLAEGGTLALHPEPTDLAVLATEVGESFRAAAQKAGVTLTVDAPDDLPLLDIDPVRIREVLANLVANALRYTPAGGAVSITALLDAFSLVLTVADTGVGIDPVMLPHVFERFVKGDGSRGSGLGLAIAHNLVAASGGEITAESTPGQGTVMTVRLPYPTS